MGDINYVRATDVDIETLVEYRLAFLADITGQHSDEELKVVRKCLENYFSKAINNESCVCWFAKDGQKIAGTGAMTVREQPGSFKNSSGKMGYIMNMYTVPEYRRRGICSELVQLLVKTGNEMGIYNFELHATKEGEPVYQKCGFTKHSEPTYRLQ